MQPVKAGPGERGRTAGGTPDPLAGQPVTIE
jgi:hypothetical protein